MKKRIVYFSLSGLILFFVLGGAGCKSQKAAQEARASKPVTPSECLPKKLDGFQLESIVEEADFAQALFTQPSSQIYLAIVISQVSQANQILQELENDFNKLDRKESSANTAWEGYSQDGFNRHFFVGFTDGPFFYEIRLRSSLRGKLGRKDLKKLSNEVVSQLEL